MEKWVKDKVPRLGDMIRVRRKVGYYHYGIALSKKEVIHYSGLQGDDVTNPENIQIRIAPIELFTKEDTLEVLDGWYSNYNAKEVVKRAKAYLGYSQFRGNFYNFFTNNCEHFARYSYYGEAESNQANNGLAAAAVLGGAVVTATVVGVTTAVKNIKRVKKKQNSQ